MQLKLSYYYRDQLTASKNNSRTHTDFQINQIASSIMEFGFTNPILVDENRTIIAGHGRLLAAEKLQIDKVPVIVLHGLTENQKKAYLIADNKLPLNAGWNDQLLRDEIKELADAQFDINILGFNLAELSALSIDTTPLETDPYKEWEGMPDFEQEDDQSFRKVIVHFDNADDVAEFFKLIEQTDTGKTKFIWFPPIEKNDFESYRYAEE